MKDKCMNNESLYPLDSRGEETAKGCDERGKSGEKDRVQLGLQVRTHEGLILRSNVTQSTVRWPYSVPVGDLR